MFSNHNLVLGYHVQTPNHYDAYSMPSFNHVPRISRLLSMLQRNRGFKISNESFSNMP